MQYLSPEQPFPGQRRRLFVHDPVSTGDPGYTGQTAAAQRSLPERALWLAGPADMVLLAQPVDAHYLAYMRQLGAGPQATFCVPGGGSACSMMQSLLAGDHWPEPFKEWAQSAATPIQIEPFCVTAESVAFTERLRQACALILPPAGDPAATLRVNHKSKVHQALDELGIARIPGDLVENTTGQISHTIQQVREVVTTLASDHKQVAIRADYSSVGAGNLLVNTLDPEPIAAWIRQRADSACFLVEAYLPWNTSPNVQYWLDANGTVELFQVTDQRIEGVSGYLGNVYPAMLHADPELLEQSEVIARWVAAAGVRGFIGIDFIDSCEHGIRFVEVNARANGSTYSAVLARRINQQRRLRGRAPLSAWRGLRSVPGVVPSFEGLLQRVPDLIYDHSKTAGVVPCSTGSLGSGDFGCVVLAPSPAQAAALEATFIDRVTIA